MFHIAVVAVLSLTFQRAVSLGRRVKSRKRDEVCGKSGEPGVICTDPSSRGRKNCRRESACEKRPEKCDGERRRCVGGNRGRSRSRRAEDSSRDKSCREELDDCSGKRRYSQQSSRASFVAQDRKSFSTLTVSAFELSRTTAQRYYASCYEDGVSGEKDPKSDASCGKARKQCESAKEVDVKCATGPAKRSIVDKTCRSERKDNGVQKTSTCNLEKYCAGRRELAAKGKIS